MINGGYAIAGAITGFMVGLTGVGGGALMTPILILFFNVIPTTAISTDLWFALITKLVGAQIHNTKGQVDWQIVKRLWTGSLPMAFFIVTLVKLNYHITKINWLNCVIGIVVLLTAIGLAFAPKLLELARKNRLENPEKFKYMQPGMTVIAGVVLGTCVTLTSVGAGALGSVILIYLYPLRMTPHRLVATDIMHAIPLTLVAGLGYLFIGTVDWFMLMSLLLGSIPAIILGSLLAKKVSGRWIQILLAIVLTITGTKMLNP
jgi:uncharacterized membrane protein YfcA